MTLNTNAPITLPTTRDLGSAAAATVVIAVLVVLTAVAGIVFGSGGLYGDDVDAISWFKGWDVANLIIGLPTLLGAMWLARRGGLIGLLLWPGALFNLSYTYALYLVGAPFNELFVAYAVIVVVSAYTTIGIVASIDADAVRRRFSSQTAQRIGGALFGIGVLAAAGLTYNVVAAYSDPAPVDPLFHASAIVDYAIGTPVLLLGGVLLWRGTRLGYVVGAGLLFLSGVGGVMFAAGNVAGAMLTYSTVDVAVIAVHLVIAAVSFALLARYIRGTAAPWYRRPDSMAIDNEPGRSARPLERDRESASTHAS